MLKTAVVILNWNGLEFLKSFLGSLAERSSCDDTSVFVADNGSDDGSCEWIEQSFSRVNVIRLGKNHGFAEGYNIALSRIEAKYYVLVNSDIEVTPGWLGPLISHLDENPDVASCQPKILSWSKRDQFEYAGAAGGFIDMYGYPFCRGRVFNVTEKDEGQYDHPAEVFWSSGACMAVRREAWVKCGGFDPDFFAHMEEIDLCWRFHRAGYRITCIPLSVVFHVGGGALPYSSPFKTYLNFRNSIRLLYKNLPESSFRKVIFIRKILDGVAAFFFLLKGQVRSFIAVLRAHRDAGKELSELNRKREEIKRLGSFENPEPVLNKSIVFGFYVMRRRTFRSMKTNFAK
ncbi:MAG: glycosyltransferase family 2 protein [Bacteroidales bacterium]|nr:glycosyltransferase family 2 protein [Bacteroidales bacterium]